MFDPFRPPPYFMHDIAAWTSVAEIIKFANLNFLEGHESFHTTGFERFNSEVKHFLFF